MKCIKNKKILKKLLQVSMKIQAPTVLEEVLVLQSLSLSIHMSLFKKKVKEDS